MKSRPILKYFEGCYKKLEEDYLKGIFITSEWAILINRMRIWGYGVQADDIVERLRAIVHEFGSNK